MTPERAREAAAVMLAFADGKKIEARRKTTGTWSVKREPVFDFCGYDYRVAPEPWEGKILVHANGDIACLEGNEPLLNLPGWRLITVKEVIH